MGNDEAIVRKFSNRKETMDWLNQKKESGDKVSQAIGIFNSIIHPGTVEAVTALEFAGFSGEEILVALAYHYINASANIMYRAENVTEESEYISRRGRYARMALESAVRMALALGVDLPSGEEGCDDDN